MYKTFTQNDLVRFLYGEMNAEESRMLQFRALEDNHLRDELLDLKEAFDLGVNYLGVCCGANPMLIREAAEAVGLKVPASKYREDMSTHMLFGTHKRIPKHQRDYMNKA